MSNVDTKNMNITFLCLLHVFVRRIVATTMSTVYIMCDAPRLMNYATSNLGLNYICLLIMSLNSIHWHVV